MSEQERWEASQELAALTAETVVRVEIWQHERSGDRYGLRMQGEDILDVVGPLNYADEEAARAGDFDGDPEDVEWIDERRDEFRLVASD